MLARLMVDSEGVTVPGAGDGRSDSSSRAGEARAAGVARGRARGRRRTTALALALLLAPAGAQEGTPGNVVSSEELGMEITLPDETWRLSDQSQGITRVLLFAPDEDPGTRCVVLRLPAAALPAGMTTREEQLQSAAGEAYRRLRLEEESLAGRPAQCLEYALGDSSRTKEWGFADAGAFVVLQISARPERWEDAASAATFAAIHDSFQYQGGAPLAAPEVDGSTPAEVRARRRARQERPPQAFELAHHCMTLRLWPAEHRLSCTDVLTVRPLQEGVETLELYTTQVSVDTVTGPEGMTWESESLEAAGPGTRALRIRFPAPLAGDAPVQLTVVTSSADYFLAVDQQLVEEIAVLGQVRESSSYSSHIVYYPIDTADDASMELTLVVPKGYTAVTGGELREVSEGTDAATGQEVTSFHYAMDQRRPRILPFGFAVGRYVSETGTSKGGLRLTVYGYPGVETRIHQRVAAAVEAASLLESMMGPLPWGDVRYAHVTPERKETGVSLPGLILISDAFFGDLSGVDLSDGNFSRRDVLGLLVVADELSHQWNIYAVPLPNELAEGISTFTNLLFIENRHGEEAWWRAVQTCQSAYLQARASARDVAIADPDIYQTTAYRGIAFCKTPAVLAMLREMLGDEPFFAAWRQAFAGFQEPEDGFEVVERAFTETTGDDLGWFFDQWFYRAGCPRLALDFHPRDGGVDVSIAQVQEGAPYRLRGVLRLTGAGGEVLDRTVELQDAGTSLSLDSPFPVRAVTFDPEGHLLREIEEPGDGS